MMDQCVTITATNSKERGSLGLCRLVSRHGSSSANPATARSVQLALNSKRRHMRNSPGPGAPGP